MRAQSQTEANGGNMSKEYLTSFCLVDCDNKLLLPVMNLADTKISIKDILNTSRKET